MRLVIVSNRLPFTITQEKDDLKFQDSAGGLATGLRMYLHSQKVSDHLWVGWPGLSVKNRIKEKLKSKILHEFKSFPVFLDEKIVQKFYNGFCNKTLYPLFNYFTSHVMYNNDYWTSYIRTNEIFCKNILEMIKPGDLVWIHDYHLMLLPKLLREKIPDLRIGFFLHIPFPSYEVFRLLPKKWGAEILEGLLGADLIGFHTYDYTQYFLRCILRILGHDHNMGQVITNDRLVKVDTFPMGIDYDRFNNSHAEVNLELDKLDALKRSGQKIIFSIDRLDYVKGITNRLEAFEMFLEQNPQWHHKVILILVVAPSRTEVEQYQHMKREIDELVGRINGKFGNIEWYPISYQYKFMNFSSLAAMYKISDVALVTPFRDGMNLVAKEYVASKTNNDGVLILSEMAGASKELGEAIIVNPNSIAEISDAIKKALEMPPEEIARRNQTMQDRLRTYDIFRWGDDFITELLLTKEEQKTFELKFLGPHKKDLLERYNNSSQRLVFLDYDGTITPFTASPKISGGPDEKVLKILRSLTEDPKNEIVIISGRRKEDLQRIFDGLDVCMVAEHGVFIKENNKEWQLARPLNTDWKSRILPILKMYQGRLPGSFIEEKEFSITWHYRVADPELASVRAKELLDDLVSFTASADVQILQGNKVVEVRNAGINKGTAAAHFVSKKNFDFMLSVGDDWTDEDMFKILPPTAYSIRVGMTPSYARFNLHNHMEVIDLLDTLVQNNDKSFQNK
ncbi:MAG: bifunctional alpha,alpha-trehalose-phosphate synthase (UDP-forming)/trehalose-phosphatase [Nitrosotalea sp.]